MRNNSPPICTHCGSTKSPLWRRGVYSEILCNACGLYWKHHGTYRPPSLKSVSDKKEPSVSSGSSADLTCKGAPDAFDDDPLRPSEGEKVGCINQNAVYAAEPKPKKNSNAPLPMGFYLRLANGAERTEPVALAGDNIFLVPADVRTSSHPHSAIVSTLVPPAANRDAPRVKYIMHRGRLLFQGDHVAISGDDGQVYYAIVKDFWHTQAGAKYFTLQWLIPRLECAAEFDGPKEKIDPAFFRLGPDHLRPESMNAIVDVFYSPQLVRRKLFLASGLSSQNHTHDVGQRSSAESFSSSPKSKRRSSCSSIDDDRRREESAGKQPCLMTSILEDVEIAHLLCSMA